MLRGHAYEVATKLSRRTGVPHIVVFGGYDRRGLSIWWVKQLGKCEVAA